MLNTTLHLAKISSVVQMTFSGLFGGRERVAYALTKLLDKNIPSSLLYLIIEERAGKDSCKELFINLDRYGIHYRLFYTGDRFSFKTLREITDSLIKDNVQIIHCHCYKSAAFSLLARLILRVQAKVTLTLHGLRLKLSRRTFHILWVNYLCLFFVDGIIGCSREVIANYIETPLLRNKITFIPNGFMQDIFESPNQKTKEECRHLFSSMFSINKDAVWIGFAGRLTYEKNVAFLLQSIGNIRALRPPEQAYEIIIAGDGELKEELMASALELGLNDIVHFTGFLSNIDDLFAALDIQVLTSTIEGTPMCILEGMACRLPVVASAVGGLPDLVEHGKTGLLYTAGDMERFCDFLLELICDPEKRERMGEHGFNKGINDFSAEIWREKHLTHYQSLL